MAIDGKQFTELRPVTEFDTNTAQFHVVLGPNEATNKKSEDVRILGDDFLSAIAAGGDMKTSIYDPTKSGKVLFAQLADSATVAIVANSVDWDDITNVPSFGEAALSNSYNDLDDLPTLGTAASKAVEDFDASGEAVTAQNYAIQRKNHTGDQLADTISDFDEAVSDQVVALLDAGDNIALKYDDGKLTISATGEGTGTVTSVKISSASSALTISGSPITTSGEIAIGLKSGSDLQAVEALSGTGVARRTGTSAWSVGDDINLESEITGVLEIKHGGTGLDKLGTKGQVLAVNDDASALEYITISGGGLPELGTKGQVLAVNDEEDDVEWITVSGTGTVTSVDIIQPAAGITTSGGPITTTGAITLALADDLAAVEALDKTGIVRRTDTDKWSAGGAVDLTTEVTGVLPEASGGSNSTVFLEAVYGAVVDILLEGNNVTLTADSKEFTVEVAATGDTNNPMTTVGDLIVGGADGEPERLGAGSENQVLTIVSGEPAWANAASGFSDPMTTKGDIIIRDTDNKTVRLGIGTDDYVLTVVSGVPAWAESKGGGDGGSGSKTAFDSISWIGGMPPTANFATLGVFEYITDVLQGVHVFSDSIAQTVYYLAHIKEGVDLGGGLTIRLLNSCHATSGDYVFDVKLARVNPNGAASAWSDVETVVVPAQDTNTKTTLSTVTFGYEDLPAGLVDNDYLWVSVTRDTADEGDDADGVARLLAVDGEVV